MSLFPMLRHVTPSRKVTSNTFLHRALRHHSTSSSKPGLFSIPGLHAPDDFLQLANTAMQECDTIRNNLKRNDFLSSHSPPSVDGKTKKAVEILTELDLLSNEVCSVIDAAEFCRCVHSSQTWRDSASRAFQILSEYISDLNSDKKLYATLRHVTDDVQTFEKLTEEEQRMATLLQSEFERSGIHLPEQKLQEVTKMQNYLTNLESDFSNNITSKKNFFDLPSREVLQIIPSHILQGSIPDQSSQRVSEGNITVSSDAHIANTLLRYSPSPSLRKEVYMQSNTACPENLEILDALIKYRHELSVQLGFQSYAEKFLKDKMAGSPETVCKFLNQMNSKVQHGARKEMDLLGRAKFQLENNSVIEPWDLPFYTAILKSHKHKLDTSSLAPYFSTENCIDGMKFLVDKLFGIQMENLPLSNEEKWNDCTDVRKLRFHHPEDGEIGTLYLDLHPREDKYVHAAHFTVRCGCATPFSKSGSTNTTDYQLPVVALVCNLSSPNTEGISLLSHSEVETLFHEFGHALHSILSRTHFQHLSGTRAPTDFVETPSHLMENFVWDETFLRAMGKHHTTGEPIPKDMVRNLVDSRHSFQCVEIQTQIMYAKFDQMLFGVPDPDVTRSTTETFENLHKDQNLPFAQGTHWHSRFGHLVTYGAGYYGYLYAEVFAADIWQTCFENDPMSRHSGKKYWKELLKHGGARDPFLMLKNTLGREPSVDSFLRIRNSE